MEEISGRLLPRFRLRPVEERRDFLAQLRRILDAAHAAGVVHNDMRGHDNVLVSDDGRVHLVDFAGAICLRPGGPVHRLMFPRLARVDDAAFLKWKRILVPEDITPEEAELLRRYERLRRFWIFNPKGWGRKDPLAAGADADSEKNRGR
jgi:serine/threonine protein kinase